MIPPQVILAGGLVLKKALDHWFSGPKAPKCEFANCPNNATMRVKCCGGVLCDQHYIRWTMLDRCPCQQHR
jgi:hypothetical protein